MLIEGLGLWLFFPSQREMHSVWNTIFFLNCHIFCPSSYYHGQNYEKNTPTILMENCDQVICLVLSVLVLYATPDKVCVFEKFIFELEAFWDNSKINSVLVRQLKPHEKMVVSSAKFATLISWSPICIPLILWSPSMKIAST